MLALPSLTSILFSTIIFFAAVWYFHRRLDEADLPKGMTRNMLVFTLATVVSFGAGAALDWVHHKLAGKPQAAQAANAAPQPTADNQVPE
jgi:hypothetical protein